MSEVIYLGAAIDIGTRRQLFVDDYLIEEMIGVSLRLHRPESRGVVMELKEAWEGSTVDYHTVVKDGSLYRIWYRGTSHWGYAVESMLKPTEAIVPVHDEAMSYAESLDGVHWTKPSLGLYEFDGSKDNNIFWRGKATDLVPFLDGNPDAPADQRYKAIGRGRIDLKTGELRDSTESVVRIDATKSRKRTRRTTREVLLALASPDGISWRYLQDEPILEDPPFDTQNVPFWDPVRGEYAIYVRGKAGSGGSFAGGVRWIRHATSPDFVNWTPLEDIDTGDEPHEHLYTNATTPYFRAPDVYLSFPRRMHPDRRRHDDAPWPGLADTVFMTSRDGVHFDWRFRESFIRPGKDPRNWMSRTNLVANGIVPTGDGELSLYVLRNRDFPSCHFERMVLRLDGFVSANAGYSCGELTTRPLEFSGSEMELNYSTSVMGSVRVEVLDSDGEVAAASREMFGDDTDEPVPWESGNVEGVAGRPVRLRFRLADADVYSFRFK